MSINSQKVLKVNFGCFNSNIDGWIGIDHALRHMIVSKIPFLSYLLWKTGVLNSEQYKWHKEGLFKTVKYGDATKRLRFKSRSVAYIYSSHMLEHLFKDDAMFFLKECFRILKKGASIRICLPGWDSFRAQPTFENSSFAKSKKEMKYSHKWFWASSELKRILSDIGFCNIIEYAFQKGNFPDLERLEHRKGLIIQAQK